MSKLFWGLGEERWGSGKTLCKMKMEVGRVRGHKSPNAPTIFQAAKYYCMEGEVAWMWGGRGAQWGGGVE